MPRKHLSADIQSASKTAIRRSRPSLPCRWLLNAGLLKGTILDHGCGYGADVKFLSEKGLQVNGWDPIWAPGKLQDRWDVGLSTYVLNTLPQQWEGQIIEDLKRWCKRSYITVRRDVEGEYWTSRGTYQRCVSLDLDILQETSAYCIYIL